MKTLLTPDMKALVWLAIGFLVLPRVAGKLGVSLPGGA